MKYLTVSVEDLIRMEALEKQKYNERLQKELWDSPVLKPEEFEALERLLPNGR